MQVFLFRRQFWWRLNWRFNRCFVKTKVISSFSKGFFLKHRPSGVCCGSTTALSTLWFWFGQFCVQECTWTLRSIILSRVHLSCACLVQYVYAEHPLPLPSLSRYHRLSPLHVGQRQAIGQCWNVYQAVLVNTNIYERTKVSRLKPHLLRSCQVLSQTCYLRAIGERHDLRLRTDRSTRLISSLVMSVTVGTPKFSLV